MEADNVRIVSGKPWIPKTDELREAYDEAVTAAQAADKAEARAQEKIKRAWDLGVPPEVLARDTGRSKKTMYRKWGPPPNGQAAHTG
jgi:hypothetical protein